MVNVFLAFYPTLAKCQDFEKKKEERKTGETTKNNGENISSHQNGPKSQYDQSNVLLV